MYFHTQFEKREGNGTKTWRTVDNALNRKACKTTPDVISIDNDDHSTPLFKSLKILKLEDLYITQLYKLYYKNVKNLLPPYFRSFTPQFNDGHNHDFRYNILRLPMTKREYFVQCTRYQFPKLIRKTPLVELNHSAYTTIVQFSGHFKYAIINQYDPICTINNCHICGLPWSVCVAYFWSCHIYFLNIKLTHSRRYMPFTVITTITNILYFPTVELIQNTPPPPHPNITLSP